MSQYAQLVPDFNLTNVEPGTFRHRREAGIVKLTRQFFPDGEDKPGKFDRSNSLAAYEREGKPFLLIEGKFNLQLGDITQL